VTLHSAELIRSISNIRGDDLAAVEQATRIGLDAIYIDLEEPRTPFSEQDRSRVRGEVGDWLHDRPPGDGTRLLARVQSIWSGQMLADAEAIAGPALAGIVLPKVDGPRDVLAADALLTALESERGMAPGSLVIYPILETAQALRQAYAIAMASPRVAYMGGAVSRFGDIVQALGYRWTPGGRESFMFRSAALLGCRSAGMPYPITGASSHDVDDLTGVRRWAEEGRALGYRGSQVRALASHVAIVNEVFST
jgi:citrate lyase subunit beta / citryl-CoA lyase